MKSDVEMTRYDNENTIISDFQMLKSKDTSFLPLSIKTLQLYNSIHKVKNWKKWIDSSGKNDPPPDFYNKKRKIMMDVMRIDDHAFVDDKGNVINNHNKRESEIINKLIKNNKNFLELAKKGNIFINPDSGLRGEQDHNYEYYINNFKRVVSNHIKKIEQYKKNHQGYKIVFFIVDESSPYIKEIKDKRPDDVDTPFFAHPHKWCFDKNMIDIIINSEIDYVIWMTPYKHFKTIEKIKIPMATIIDVKRIKKDYLIDYDKNKMKSLEI